MAGNQVALLDLLLARGVILRIASRCSATDAHIR